MSFQQIQFYWNKNLSNPTSFHQTLTHIKAAKEHSVLFSRTLRLPRSNNLEIQNNENSKWKLVKTRWNPNFGLSDLENDLLTSTTSEGAQWIFSKNTFLKSVDQAEKNEL